MSTEEKLTPEESVLPSENSEGNQSVVGQEDSEQTSKPAKDGKVVNAESSGDVAPGDGDQDASGDQDAPRDGGVILGGEIRKVEADFVLVDDAEGGHDDPGATGHEEDQRGEEEPMEEGGEGIQVGESGDIHEGESDDGMQDKPHRGQGDEHEDDSFHSREENDDVDSECYDEGEDGFEPGEGGPTSDTDNLQSVVNQVLDTKMQGFQAQMQQMLAMIQNVATGKTTAAAPGPAVRAAAPPEIKPEEKPEPVEKRSVSQREGTGSVQPETPEQKHFKEFLATVCRTLEMPMSTVQKERSFLDDAVETDAIPPAVDSLPVEGMVKNSWQKVEGKYLNEVVITREKGFRDYPWGTEDMLAFGETRSVNGDMLCHLKQKGWRPGKSKIPYMKFEPDAKKMETIFRYQQRILSYASYFLAAMGKTLKPQGESGGASSEGVPEILKYLSKCLMDTCDMSVQGCIVATKMRRRMYLDAMEVTSNSHYTILNRPLAKQLFPPDLDSTFKEFGIEFLSTPPTTPAGRGGGAMPGVPRPQNAVAHQNQTLSANQIRKRAKAARKHQLQAQAAGRARGGDGGSGGNRGRQPGSQGRGGGNQRGGRQQGQGNQASRKQQSPRGGVWVQDASSNKRSRQRSPEPSRQRRSAERSQERGGQGRNSGTGRRRSSFGREEAPRDPKRRRSPPDFRAESRPQGIPGVRSERSALGFSNASMNIERLTGRSSLYGPAYDSLLGGAGRSSLYPSMSHPPLSTSYPLGGGYSRPGMSPSVLASLAPLDANSHLEREGFQGSDDGF